MENRRAETTGLTLGGILSIKQTPPYRIHARTLLDLIRDDQISGNESKTPWKIFRQKLRLKLSGSVCSTTGPTLASHVHITTAAAAGNRTPPQSVSVSVSPPVNQQTASNTSSVPDTENVMPVTEESRVAGGEPAAERMSLMSLLEVEASAYLNDDDDDDDDNNNNNNNNKEEEVEENDDVAMGESGFGGGGGYNNCCVCMVRHKGAAFIPCGHTFCRLCSREVFVKRASCPLCNHIIVEILDIF